MLPEVRPATEDELPIVDLKNFAYTEKEKAEIVDIIGKTARNAGFFYVINHGIPDEAIDDIFACAEEFFALPLPAKDEVSIKKSGWNFHGYLPSFHKGRDPKLKENLQEAFQIHLEYSKTHPAVAKGVPLYGPNLWPTAMPDLRPRMTAYQARLKLMGERLMGLFALALGLPEDGLAPDLQAPTSILRLLHYPPQAPDSSADHIGTRAHTDTGIITILSQDQIGGLEVMLKTGEWVSATPRKHSYVINLGEVMRSWSDGLFAATPHRVINRYGAERYSVPYFVNPNYHATFEPKIRNTETRDGKFEALIPHKDHSCYGDWIMEVFSRIYYDPAANAA